jgi:hypothetical protein
MSTNQFGRLLAYRYALAVAREIRQRPGVAEAIRRGVTTLDKQLAGLEPNKMSVAEGRRLYFAFMRKAERIRRSLLADLRFELAGWTHIGYTADASFPGHVYMAPVGTPAPWERAELQPWEK